MSCWSRVRVTKSQQDPTSNLVGRPRGPRMRCGWGCGAQLTGRNMRAHLTICAKRPAASDHVEPGGNAKAKRGRPQGGEYCAGGAAVAIHLPVSSIKVEFL